MLQVERTRVIGVLQRPLDETNSRVGGKTRKKWRYAQREVQRENGEEEHGGEYDWRTWSRERIRPASPWRQFAKLSRAYRSVLRYGRRSANDNRPT